MCDYSLRTVFQNICSVINSGFLFCIRFLRCFYRVDTHWLLSNRCRTPCKITHTHTHIRNYLGLKVPPSLHQISLPKRCLQCAQNRCTLKRSLHEGLPDSLISAYSVSADFFSSFAAPHLFRWVNRTLF